MVHCTLCFYIMEFASFRTPGPTDTTTNTYYDDNEPIDDAACESSVALGLLVALTQFM